jgi:eukaryotic-like serine/threonine-protein kinase
MMSGTASAGLPPTGGPRVSIGQYSIAGAKARNDDSYGVLVPEPAMLVSHGIAMAIADGMSSSEGAKEASENCVKSFLTDYYCTHASWSVKKSVGVVLRAVNSWLFAQGQRQHDSERGMVSTFSGLVLKAGTAHIFHAGDTRISRISNGQLEALTRDHRINIGGGREQLSRAFGIGQNIEVDYRAEVLDAGDVLLFTTDGVHDTLPASELIALVANHGHDLAKTAERVVARALEQGSTDNLTCQIVRVEHPGAVDEAAHLKTLTALPFPPDLSPGMSFEGYRILSELHTSKRTQVYLARDEASGKQVVIKTPSVNFEDEPTYIEMFIREEWVGKLAAGPHVLPIVPHERPRKSLYIVTEFFDGQTLRQWMRDHPQPDFETVRAIVDQIAKGLRGFHRKDILHQDLKPENVMIDAQGLVKIIDFGSARVAGMDERASDERPWTKSKWTESKLSDSKSTETKSPGAAPRLVGTVDYTAPEYHTGEPATNRSDIYAVGVIAYEILTGSHPYGRGFARARDIERLDYRPAFNVREDIPAWMDAALAKAVQKRPSERTDVLSALVEDLRRPNAALGYDRPRPLMERNPVAVWRTLALAMVALNIVLLALLAR